MIALLLMLAVGTPAPPVLIPGGPACASATVELDRGMRPEDYEDLKKAFAEWLEKVKKDCEDPEA